MELYFVVTNVCYTYNVHCDIELEITGFASVMKMYINISDNLL